MAPRAPFPAGFLASLREIGLCARRTAGQGQGRCGGAPLSRRERNQPQDSSVACFSRFSPLACFPVVYCAFRHMLAAPCPSRGRRPLACSASQETARQCSCAATAAGHRARRAGAGRDRSLPAARAWRALPAAERPLQQRCVDKGCETGASEDGAKEGGAATERRREKPAEVWWQ